MGTVTSVTLVTVKGTKIRSFAPLPNLSLEELVPKDNFYRRLDRKLDLSFVRILVKDYYASWGRPSVDPVIFFRLQLVIDLVYLGIVYYCLCGLPAF